jgi:uncharacterized SAM-binding protein YcdF (DUF218 family)
MLYTFSKIIDRFLDPIGFIWLILMLAFVRALFKKKASQALFLGGLALFMTIFGGTRLPSWLLARMEQQYVVDTLEFLPECDAVVVLGSGHSFNSTGVIHIEFNAAVDRIIVATELVRQRKGKVLLIGGGYPPRDGLQPEGIILKQWLESWEVIDNPILELGVNRNTRDEAIHTAALSIEKGWNKILLVTSAWHMRRSVAAFRKAGLEVIPVGADFIGTDALERKCDFCPVPSIETFSHLKLYMHEQVGWWYYKFRDWI